MMQYEVWSMEQGGGGRQAHKAPSLQTRQAQGTPASRQGNNDRCYAYFYDKEHNSTFY